MELRVVGNEISLASLNLQTHRRRSTYAEQNQIELPRLSSRGFVKQKMKQSDDWNFYQQNLKIYLGLWVLTVKR